MFEFTENGIRFSTAIKSFEIWTYISKSFFTAKYAYTVFSQLNAPGVYFKLGLMEEAFIQILQFIQALCL